MFGRTKTESQSTNPGTPAPFAERIHYESFYLMATYDIKSKICSKPFAVKNKIEALRSFEQEIKQNKNSTLALYPTSFNLICIGKYTDDGTLEPFDKHETLANGAEFAAPITQGETHEPRLV